MTAAAETSGTRPINVPREIVNADSVFLVSWRVDDGASVESGAGLCDVETSKAVVTLEAEEAGYVRQLAAVGAEVPVGGIVGYLTARPDTPLPAQAAASKGDEGSGPAGGADRISGKARRKMEELGIDPALFAGRGLIREQDVVELAASIKAATAASEDPRGPFDVEPLSPIQRRVARVMESASNIPVSYLERSVDLDPVRERAKALAAASGGIVSELDLLVSAVATACKQHPRFNGSMRSDHELRLYRSVNVGVAVDVQGELFVVVLRDAASKDDQNIARELRTLQYVAQRRRASVEQLSGGTVTVTSMLGRGVQRFTPLMYPEQAAIVGLCDAAPGTSLTSVVLGFDHRVTNGSGAAQFLADIVKAFIAP